MFEKIHELAKRERSSLIRSAINMLAVGGGQVVMRLSALLISIVVAKNADSETFGAFTLFITIFVISAEVPRAFDASYIRHANHPDRDVSQDSYWLLSLVSKYISVLLSTVLVFVYYQFDFVDGAHQELVAYSVIAGTLFCVYSTYVSYYQRLKSYIKYSLFAPIPYLLILIILLIFLMGDSVVEIGLIQNIYLGVAITFSIFAGVFVVKKSDIDFTMLHKSFFRYYKLALLLLATAFITMISGRFDVFILTNYISLDELADYGIGLRVALLISVVTGVISVILYPKAPESLISRIKYKRYLGLSFIYLIPQTLLATCLVYWIGFVISMLFGEAYNTEISRAISIILILNMLMTSYSVPFQALIQSGDKPKILMYMSLIRSVITFATLLFFVPLYGVEGAALTMLAVSVLYFASVSVVSMKTSRVIETAG